MKSATAAVDLERPQRVLPLGDDLQRLPAGRHDPELRAAIDELGNVGRGRVDDLLEVVQQHKRLLVADQRDDPLCERPALGFLHVERLGEGGNELGRVGDVGHRDEHETVEKVGRESASQLDQDPGLADAARADDADEPVLANKLDERGQVDGPSQELRAGLGQVARESGPVALPLQRCRVGHDEAVRRDGVQLEGPPDVLELESPERNDLDVAPVLQRCVRGVGEHHAAGHGEGLDPRCDVDGLAGEPLRLDDDLADVDADSNGDVLRRELLLHRDRGLHRGERAREHAHAPVAEPLDNRPAEGVVLAVERAHVPVALLDGGLLVGLDQHRVADHVGEHHRDEPAIERLAHGGHVTATANSRCVPSSPFSSTSRLSRNSIPESATRSWTRLETSTSPPSAWLATRAA